MADNQVGSQAVASVNLTVLHAPVISMTRSLHSGHNRVKLVLGCGVVAQPRAEVRWYKDTMLLDPSHRRQMESTGSRY